MDWVEELPSTLVEEHRYLGLHVPVKDHQVLFLLMSAFTKLGQLSDSKNDKKNSVQDVASFFTSERHLQFGQCNKRVVLQYFSCNGQEA